MLELEILICELRCAVDICRSGPVAIQKVASLDHEILDLSVLSHTLSGSMTSVQNLTTRWNLEAL